MNLIHNIKKHFIDGVTNNMGLAMLSLILAVIVWFMISMAVNPSESKTISAMPLTVDILDSPVTENDLYVFPCETEKVQVKIKGSKTQIRNLNEETLEAYVDFSTVTAPGKYNLPVLLKSKIGTEYELESISPSTVSVSVDRYETKSFPVTPKLRNVTFAEGKVPDEYICEPQTIDISGPSKLLETVDSCCVFSDTEMKDKDSSFNVRADNIKLYSADGVEVDQTPMEFSASSFVVTVNVLTQKTVTARVQIVNAPDNFDKSCLKLKYTPETLTIASKNSNSEIPDFYDIQKINLSDLDLGYSKDFDISEKLEEAGMVNKSGIDSVNVSLDGTGLARKEISLDAENIHLSNVPNDNYDYQVLNRKLIITVIGPEQVVDQLSSTDFIADANLLNVDSSIQQISQGAIITCVTHDNVWSVTKTTIAIQKTPKTETSIESSDER